MTENVGRTNIRYGENLEILGTYRVSTKVDTKFFSGEAAQSVARDYMSSGTVGAVLAELATTGECDLAALLSDIMATRVTLRYPGGSATAARHAANFDNLARWAFETAVEVFETGNCAECGEDIMDDRTKCEDCE